MRATRAHWKPKPTRRSRPTHRKSYGRRVPPALKRQVLEQANWTCQSCSAHGRTQEATEVDHIIPLFKGGTNDITNLQALCHECHSNKTSDDKGHRLKGTCRHGYPYSGNHRCPHCPPDDPTWARWTSRPKLLNPLEEQLDFSGEPADPEPQFANWKCRQRYYRRKGLEPRLNP